MNARVNPPSLRARVLLVAGCPRRARAARGEMKDEGGRMRDENKGGRIEAKDESVFPRARPLVFHPSSFIPHPLQWSPLWSRLWKALGIATGIAALVLFVAFLVLEAVGLFYCEWNGIPNVNSTFNVNSTLGCSTLSYWSVANFGPLAMIRGTLIAAGIVNVLLAWLCFHWWDVARRQKK